MDETVIGTDGREARVGALLETTAGVVFSSQLSGIWSRVRVSNQLESLGVINSINETDRPT